MTLSKLIQACLAALLVSCLTGCTTVQHNISSEFHGGCYNKQLPQLLDATDLKTLFHDIAKELCVDRCGGCKEQSTKDQTDNDSSICQDCESNKRLTVMVTDFADLQTYVPNQYGLVLGELMRSSLNNVCCYNIIQAEFGKYFKLSEKGLIILTRAVTEIKHNEYAQSEAVIGTYSYQNNNKVVIFVRRINMETGKIIKMVTKELDYSCLVRSIKYSVR